MITSDLIAYLSGNLPSGFIVLPVALVAFTIIWLAVWWGTGFWERSRLFSVWVMGWVIIVGIYAVVWKRSHPSPIPIRVIVTAYPGRGNEEARKRGGIPDDTLKAPSAGWEVQGLVDIIERRLSASPKHFVLQRSDFIHVLNRSRFSRPGLDSLAFRMKALWLILVSSHDGGDDRNLLIEVRRRTYNGFEPAVDLSAGGGTFFSESVKIAGDVARLMGDEAPPQGLYGLPPNLPDEVFSTLYRAIELRASDECDSAAALLTDLTEAYPEWSRPFQELALTRLGHYASYHRDEIHILLVNALRIDASDPENYILLGRHFLKFRDWLEAESALKLALNYTIDDPRLFFYLSRLRWDRVNELPWRTRTDLVYHALHLSPAYETARLALADTYRTKGDRYTALTLLNKGLELDPESIPLLMAKTANMVELIPDEETIALIQQVLDRRPGNPAALYNMGIARYFMGQWDEAIALFDSSYRNGGSIDNLYYLGVVYQRKNDWKNAIHYFQERMIRPTDEWDQVAVSARERIKRIKGWMAEEDSAKARERTVP